MNKIFKFLYYKFLSANKVAKLEGVNFGKNCIFRTKLFGSEPYLIHIGDDFKTAGNVQFITHDGGVHVLRNIFSELKNIDSFENIRIGNNVFIGYGAIILPGTSIGDNVIVGAGSVVRGVLEGNSVYAGVPVKKICDINNYVERNKYKFLDSKLMSDSQKKEYLINLNKMEKE